MIYSRQRTKSRSEFNAGPAVNQQDMLHSIIGHNFTNMHISIFCYRHFMLTDDTPDFGHHNTPQCLDGWFLGKQQQ
jgi:hypothetical protein